MGAVCGPAGCRDGCCGAGVAYQQPKIIPNQSYGCCQPNYCQRCQQCCNTCNSCCCQSCGQQAVIVDPLVIPSGAYLTPVYQPNQIIPGTSAQRFPQPHNQILAPPLISTPTTYYPYSTGINTGSHLIKRPF